MAIRFTSEHAFTLAPLTSLIFDPHWEYGQSAQRSHCGSDTSESGTTPLLE